MATSFVQKNRPPVDLSPALRTPPQALDMEQALLGALLIDPDAYSRIADIIDETGFYSPKHQAIFQAIRTLANEYNPIDLLTVSEQLRKESRLDEIGGSLYLSEMVQALPSAANIEYYARIVAEKAMLRRLITLGSEAATSAYDPTAAADSVVEFFQQQLVSIVRERRGRNVVRLDSLVHDTYAYVEQIKQSKEYITGVGSGFPGLDDLTTGFNPGEFIIIAARPSMGKTTLAMNMARAAAGHSGKPVAVFSLEMDARQLLLRMLSNESHIFLQKLRTTARLTPDEWQRLTLACSRLAELPMFIDDSANLGIEPLRARARQLWMEHKIGMIVIDYLQLIQPPKMADNLQQWVAFVSSSLKSLAKELGVPVICLSQLSRAPEQRGGDRRPMLSDLRDSGAIEQDADIVMFVYRPWVYREQTKSKKHEIMGKEYDITEHLAEVIVAKNRNGPTGSVPLSFLGEYTMFAPFADEPAGIPAANGPGDDGDEGDVGF